MIQDIGPLQLDNTYRPGATAAAGDPVLLIRGAEICVSEDAGSFFLIVKTLQMSL